MTIDYVPPSSGEWATLQAQAEVLARTNYVPKAFRGKPDAILAVALLARELSLPPIAALSLIDDIDGSPTLSAEGKVAVVRAKGHSITGTASPTEAIVSGRRADTGDELEVTFTIAEAQRMRLTGKHNWQTAPADMLWARAVSRLCRRLFSDVTAGLTGDELGPALEIDGTPPAGGQDGRAPGMVPEESSGRPVVVPEHETPGVSPPVRRRPPPTTTSRPGSMDDPVEPAAPVSRPPAQPGLGRPPEPRVSERWVAEARFLVASLGLSDERLADLVHYATAGEASRLEDVPRPLANSVASLLKSLTPEEPAGDEYEAEGPGDSYGEGEEPFG